MQKINLDRRTIVFFLTIAFFVIELFILLPWSIKRISLLNSKIKGVKQQLKIVEEDWPRRDEYLTKKKQLEDNIKIVQTKFLSPNQESKVLSYISASSKDFEVKIEDFLPGRLTLCASTNFGVFNYLPITISAKSKFHNLAMFIDYLQNGPYFFSVNNLKISSEYPYHGVSMVMSTLVMQEKK